MTKKTITLNVLPETVLRLANLTKKLGKPRGVVIDQLCEIGGLSEELETLERIKERAHHEGYKKAFEKITAKLSAE